jgi:hypothetical protein
MATHLHNVNRYVTQKEDPGLNQMKCQYSEMEQSCTVHHVYI